MTGVATPGDSVALTGVLGVEGGLALANNILSGGCPRALGLVPPLSHRSAAEYSAARNGDPQACARARSPETGSRNAWLSLRTLRLVA